VGVLIAVVDSAQFTATYSEEGSVMYKLLLHVKNTQKQYLRVSLPKGSEIWTTLVKGSAVKPAIDDQSRIMVPLEKAARGSDDQTVQSVEIIYILKGNVLQGRGFIDVSFPPCDIPISRLYVSLFLPSNFKYGEFTGMKFVHYFSGTVPVAQLAPTHSMSKKKEKKRRDYSDEDENNYDSASESEYVQRRGSVLMDEKAMDMTMDKAWYPSNKYQQRGIRPVQVEMPTTGEEHRFEELLVTEKTIKISVEYKKQAEKGCCNRRNVDGCC